MRPAEADCRRLRDCPAARSQGARATLRCSTGGYADSCTVPKAWKKMVVAAMAVQAVGAGQTRLRRIAAHLAGARSEVAAAGFEEAPRGPLSDEQIDQFDRDGFLNSGEHLLTEAEVTELSEALDDIIVKGPEGFVEQDHAPVSFRSFSGSADPESRPNWQIVNTWEASEAFHRLIFHPKIVSAISQLTRANDLMVWHDQVQYKPADYGGSTGWHQDAPLWPSVLPNTMITAWVPMDDVEPANGAMWMLPGSHTWGDQHKVGSIAAASIRDGSPLADLEGFGDLQLDSFSPPALPGSRPVSSPRPCPVRRGQVHFHHSLTWHGSPNNSSRNRRRAIGIHYMTGDTFFVASGGHLMQKFVNEHGAIGDGGPMLEAGPHFPQVMRKGVLRTAEQSPRPKPGAGVIRTGMIRPVK